MSSSSESNRWILGVVLGLLGSVAINTGNNIQSLGIKNLKEEEILQQGDQDLKSPSKKRRRASLAKQFNKPARTVPTGHHNGDTTEGAKLRPEEETREINLLSSKTWILGTFIFVSGSMLNFASYAFAAQSMLASLESIQFVTNILFGKFMLGARVTRIMYMGTLLTVTGTLVAVQFSSKKTLDLNTADMKKLYLNPVYIMYLFCVVGLLFVLDGIYRYYDRRKQQNIPVRYTSIVMPITYAVWSALFGTQSVVQAKVLAELLAVQSAGQEKIFDSWFTYVTILFWLVTVAVWLMRLNDALSKFNPLFIIPLLQCSFIFFAIVTGGIFFKEFNDFKPAQWCGFCFGVMVMFCGLALLTPSDDRDDYEKRLPEEIVKYLMDCGGVAPTNERGGVSIIRPPLTPAPTPRKESENSSTQLENDVNQEELQQQEECVDNKLKLTFDDSGISAVLTHPDTSSSSHVITPRLDCPNHTYETGATTNSERTWHRSQAGSVMELVRGAVIDSARETKRIMSSPNGTAVLTNAMSSVNEERKREIKRRERVRQLCSLIAKHQACAKAGGNDRSEEIYAIVEELKIEMKQFIDSATKSSKDAETQEAQMQEAWSPKTRQYEKIMGNSEVGTANDVELPIVLETRTGEKISLHEMIFKDIHN